jgi:hypothetical protein
MNSTFMFLCFFVIVSSSFVGFTGNSAVPPWLTQPVVLQVIPFDGFAVVFTLLAPTSELQSRVKINRSYASYFGGAADSITVRRVNGESLPITGPVSAGPIPESLQKITTSFAGSLRHTSNQKHAKQRPAYLASTEVAPIIATTSLRPVVLEIPTPESKQ